MRKTILAVALGSSIFLPGVASAQSAPAAAPASPHTITGNLGLFSSYRFRGIDQTFGKPAIQGGIDYSHASGIYLGNWNSNVSEYAGFPEGNIEMDFYGGYKTSFGDFGLDVGFLYYYYPGSRAQPLVNANAPTAQNTGTIDNKEIYIGGSWKFLSLKYFHAIDDYFSVPETKNSNYIDLSANFDLGNGWGVNAHVGRLKFKNFSNGVQDGDYTDWKIGVTKDLGGWILGAAYVDTNAKDGVGEPYRWVKPSGKDYEAGKGVLVVSVSKTF